MICPKCGCRKFQRGPSAGLSQNWRCEEGHCWNITPFGYESIGENHEDVPGCSCRKVEP